MIKMHNARAKLSLTVQYGCANEQLPRWRLRRWVEAAIAAASRSDLQTVTLTLRLADRHEARTLNRTYRAKDYATNVLTFNYLEEPPHIAADIVICTAVLAQEARSMGKPLRDHAAHLVIHGTLHALGHDHLNAAQARAMQAIEVKALARFGIANPYEI